VYETQKYPGVLNRAHPYILDWQHLFNVSHIISLFAVVKKMVFKYEQNSLVLFVLLFNSHLNYVEYLSAGKFNYTIR